MVRLAHHDYPEHVEGPPPPLPCGVCFTTPQGRPSPVQRGMGILLFLRRNLFNLTFSYFQNVEGSNRLPIFPKTL
jgi:hypothetical protein